MTSDAQPPEPPAAASRPGRRRRRWLLIGLAAVVLIGAGLGAFQLLRPAAQPQASTRTVPVSRGTQTLTVSLTGTLAPRKQSNLNFAVAGTVTDVYVKAGDTVKKGEKLARIDDADLSAAVTLARANLSTARANLDEVQDNDGSDASVRSARAQVSSARAALTQAEQDLADAVLRATVAGTVAGVELEVGDTVSGGGSAANPGSTGDGSSTGGGTSSGAGTAAQVTVISTATWKLSGSVGTADLGSLKAGQPARVTTDGSTRPLTATVASVGIVATSSSDGTATFPVTVNLSGTHTDLYSGTTGTAVVTIGSYPDVLTVPTLALRAENGATVVSRVVDGQVSTVRVEVGRVFGNATEITSGLSEGDQVQITLARPAGTASTNQNQGGPGGFGGGFGGLPDDRPQPARTGR